MVNRCCSDAVKHAAPWQFDEGEVECDWCGTYVPVSTVASDLLTTSPVWPPPSGPAHTHHMSIGCVIDVEDLTPKRLLPPKKRTLRNGGRTQFFPPFGPGVAAWKPSGLTLPVPIGLGPEPPRHPSPAREAFRTWLIDEVFGGPNEMIEGSASLLADMISYSLEKRNEQRKRDAGNLYVEINNLLGLLVDQNPHLWEALTIRSIDTPGPFTAVGWATDSGEVLSVAVTGTEGDTEAEDLAQFIEAMPELLWKLKEFLADPL